MVSMRWGIGRIGEGARAAVALVAVAAWTAAQLGCSQSGSAVQDAALAVQDAARESGPESSRPSIVAGQGQSLVQEFVHLFPVAAIAAIDARGADARLVEWDGADEAMGIVRGHPRTE